MKKNTIITGIFVFSFCLMFISCAHLGGQQTRKDELRSAVVTLWDAKVEKDWNTVYDMMCSAYKKKVKRSAFVRGSLVDIKDYVVLDLNVDDGKREAFATVSCTIATRGFNFPMKITNSWVRENALWRLNPSILPF